MNAAVIIETRPLPNLNEVITGHMQFLPGWELNIFCNKDNLNYVQELFPLARTHLIKYSFLHDLEYNLILTSKTFWNILEHYQRVLIFQHDSKILREGIDEFLEFDYVGAPWKFQHKGGNGGLSLRNPRAMLKTIEKTEHRAIHGNEDVYFSNNLQGNLAPREVCERFSCETIFKLGTFGCHAIEKWLTPVQQEQILTQYKNCSAKKQLIS